MLKIDNGDGLRDFNLNDLMNEFQDEVLRMEGEDLDTIEVELITSQYAYVKFGLMLEKIRTRSWWRKCSEKFSDFRNFCQVKVNLNIWQVSNAIKSATVAIRLAYLGFTELPRNASQALKLADLSIERLGEVWGNVLSKCPAHKITALAIESEVNPDKVITSETVRLPARVADALRGQAIAAGMTLTQYLEELAFLRDEDDSIETTETAIEINPEMSAIIDRVEYQWLKPSSVIDRAVDRFDELLTGLVGQFIPPVRKVAND